MNIIEIDMELVNLYVKLKELKAAYKENKHLLILNYVKENAVFKIDDFIGNVTGIIKVEKISYDYCKKFKTLDITYSGKRYWKSKGELILTKNQRRHTTLREKQCKLINI